MSEALFTTLKAANRLPSPPAVAMRILELVADENATLDDLEKVISTDPALTAKFLKYLNSPLIGLGFEGTTLLAAVARIGTRGTQLLALSFSLLTPRQQQSCPSFSPTRFWSESLARAVAARSLARATRQWPADEAFITGLVYRLGQLTLATVLPKEYEAVLGVQTGSPQTLEEREWEAFGCDHVELGRQLLQHWKLPETVWSAFTSEGEPTPPEVLLRLADGIAVFLARGEQHHGRNMEAVLTLIQERTGCDLETANTFLEQTIQDWQNYGSVLSVSTGVPPDLDALQAEAEEYRTTLRLASELEVNQLRTDQQQLGYLTSRDRLSGLLDRNAFDQALAGALDQAAHLRRGLALMMINIDQLRGINERHGHPAGDAVLLQVARFLRALAAPPAEAFRYGSEDFAVIIPGASYEQAMTIAETLRDAIESSPPTQAGKTIRFTASLGVASACWPEHAQTAESLVAAAGARLFDAKQAGGNAVK